uniref:Uncharacterized protein n=1 Tax=Alexandrium monilatum TaxID=311494 RepID=A0A7S4UZV8_9DINO
MAALARFPVFTRVRGRAHPRMGFKEASGMFQWEAIAKELGVSQEEAMRRAFGRGSKTYHFIPQRARIDGNLPKVGILLRNEVITEDEERSAMAYLRGAGVAWQPREHRGLRANFGPTLTPQYKVHRHYRLTKIPSALEPLRRKLLGLLTSSEDVRRFAMTPRVRDGHIGHSEEECFNQALLQRYQGGIDPADAHSQALPMHLDQRDDWAEVIAAVSLGSPGHIFFSSSKPGTCLTEREMLRLVRQRKGVLLRLPPRSAYAFYGFARYGLCHGVAGPNGGPHGNGFDRITVTWRSVKAPLEPALDPPRELPGAGSREDVGLWGQHG